MRILLLFICFLGSTTISYGQKYLLKPSKVFDGEGVYNNWIVVVGEKEIIYAGKESGYDFSDPVETIDMEGSTLMPGMIEGHSHVLLYPYDQTSWSDQVLKESPELRSIRGAKNATKSLMAGFTTIRDLGSEGAGYADVAIKQSIEKGIIKGPRMLVAGPAIVATGSYGPKGFHDGVQVPLGAEEADLNDIVKVTRRQIGNGVDFIKVYADYRWGPNGTAQPTFSIAELKLMVETAKSSGRYVVAHASTEEGMRRAILAGVETIEHGDGGTDAIFQLMKEKNVALCPTLAAGDAISQYRGWKKGIEPEPERIKNKKASFSKALKNGVKIVPGGDVGVFEHGSNALELEMMVEYGMKPLNVLRLATSGNADTFHLGKLGKIKAGFFADIIAVEGDPSKDISDLRKVHFVMKEGFIYRR
ncbi:MAG: amidohydrolase family protein [Bacteroidota bacterium]